MRDKTSRKSERDVVGGGVGLVVGSGWSVSGIRPAIEKLVGAVVENLRCLGTDTMMSMKINLHFPICLMVNTPDIAPVHVYRSVKVTVERSVRVLVIDARERLLEHGYRLDTDIFLQCTSFRFVVFRKDLVRSS